MEMGWLEHSDTNLAHMSRTEVGLGWLVGWQEKKEGGEDDILRHRSIIG
jgi:hypothetical protein